MLLSLIVMVEDGTGSVYCVCMCIACAMQYCVYMCMNVACIVVFVWFHVCVYHVLCLCVGVCA